MRGEAEQVHNERNLERHRKKLFNSPIRDSFFRVRSRRVPFEDTATGEADVERQIGVSVSLENNIHWAAEGVLSPFSTLLDIQSLLDPQILNIIYAAQAAPIPHKSNISCEKIELSSNQAGVNSKQVRLFGAQDQSGETWFRYFCSGACVCCQSVLGRECAHGMKLSSYLSLLRLRQALVNHPSGM